MPRSSNLHAAYLHSRQPADSRIALWSDEGASAPASALPAELAARAGTVLVQMLIPSEEASLRPLLANGGDDREEEDRPQARIAPALWTIPATGLPLRDAVPWLATLDARQQQPGMRALVAASQLVMRLIARGDFAPAPQPGVLRYAPHWGKNTQWVLAAIAELVPGMLCTARFAVPDDPVFAVTQRNYLVSFVGHALDQVLADAERSAAAKPRFEKAERLPRDYWQTPMVPVVEILVPDTPLEEGAPWGLQVLVRPVPTVAFTETIESLHQRLAASPFPNEIATDSIYRVEQTFERVSEKVPALRRARNMSDGRASLTRPELDQILDHLPLLESEGMELTLPGVESMQRLSARVAIVEASGHTGDPRPWFEFRWSLAIGDQELSQSEFEQLVDARTPLVFIDRRPVLLSPKDREALRDFKKRMQEGGERISFFEALRLRLGGASHLHGLAMESIASTPRLEKLLQNLEQARVVEDLPIPVEFHGELRPYQARGHAWMHFLVDQGFGACLADDMGLGKTVQAITVMLEWRKRPASAGAILIVCPVSVLGNWRREIHRFAPSLRVVMHHGKGRAETAEQFRDMIANHDIVLTSYNLLQRDEEIMAEVTFDGVVLDEAQNIKNPATRQSKAARQLKGHFRLALTGTPLENRPLDLWSIMDFLNEGLLGSRTQFTQTLEHPIVKQRRQGSMSALARLVRPFVLRRLKTDPEIVADLPEKSEQIVSATLTREQAILYESVVRKGLQEVEKAAEGIQRRGAILTTLLRLKQVCNHPTHYLMDGSSLPSRSGKLDLLTEMIEEAIEEGDRSLVFTQFKEMGSLLKTQLENVLGQPVLFLHGGVPQKERDQMVTDFQESRPDGPKVFVLSLKAGGTGLNLTAANRVFHFDRWWNPAVEDQATDRAFRIGQQRNVFVHKFVCNGTLEERIQQMLERKREVADSLLAAGETWITELSNDELKRLLTLDRKEALA
ncbi:MAG TPA: DEAD/DEAH box helicase [Planctomycetota bacterium]|nr:DEAD/DEAH box helicase [Planctomycetota bacterium]